MTEIVISSLYWFVLAVIIACIEIEAEGFFGWAEKFETWYRTNTWYAKIYGIFMAKKPLTGYHMFMFFLPIMIFHTPFFMGLPWSWTAEAVTWSIYFAFCPVWDFSWFILNPHYTLENFTPKHVWWHSQSYWIFGKLPLDYVIGWIISVLVVVPLYLFDHNPKPLQDALTRLELFTLFLLGLIFVAPLYHNWYLNMRRKDDRDKIRIVKP